MLDPRIAQGARSFAPDSPQDSMMRALQLITAQRQNALQQMQMQAYGEDRQAKQAQQKNALAMQNQQRNYLGSLDASQGPAMPFSVPNALAQGLPMEQIEALNKALGPRKVARVIETANGMQQTDDMGGMVGSPLPRFVAPQLVDQGDRKQFVTPTAGMSLPVGMSPAQSAQDRRAREQLAQSQQQFNTRRADEAAKTAAEREQGVAEAGGPGQAALVKQLGKPAPGYRWKPDGSQEAIPGGPADRKNTDAGIREQRSRDASVAQADRVIAKVDQALGGVGFLTAGPGAALSGVPGTSARNLQSTLETIKANLGFAELQAMRDASPTGGALGAIAVQELTALQATVASLDQGQSPEQLRKSLGDIKTHYTRWKDAVKGNEPAAPAAPTSGPAVGTVESGYRFKGGNPADAKNWEKQ